VSAPARESPHVSSPLPWLAPLVRTLSPSGVAPITRPAIPRSHLVPWRRSGVGAGRGHKVRASRTKVKVKASRTKVKMSSSGSEGTVPASVDHSGKHGPPPGTIPPPVGGIILGVTLPASRTVDAAPPTLLAPTMLVRLYRVVVGVVPAPPEDVNMAERLQQFMAMRPDLATCWAREQRRGFLTSLDTAALLSADHGAGEVAHSNPRPTFGAERAPCAPGSASATCIYGFPDCLIQDPAVEYDSIILAPVVSAPVEDEYPGWLAATVSRFKALAAPSAYPNVLFMPIPGPYLHWLPILPPSSHATTEPRAPLRGFLISWTHQEFWLLPPVMRTQPLAAVPTWFTQMEAPIGITTGGSLVAYYARDEIYRSCWDAHSVTMAIPVTEYFVMACTRWYEEARDRLFWLFSDALFGWVMQLRLERLAGDDTEALGIFQAMLALRATRPVHDQAFHDAVRRLDTSRREQDGWLTVVTR